MTKSMKTVTRVTGIALLASAAVVLLTLIISAIAGRCTGDLAALMICGILVACFGAFYLFTGASKNPGGKLFKIYLTLSAVNSLLLFINPLPNFLMLIDIAIQFAGFCILAVANDLGEVKSKVIAVLIGALNIITFFALVPSMNGGFAAVLGNLARIIIALSVVVLTWAKYADKKARGTK